ncbi:MAG: conjugal transfer protein TrbK [Mesorhizobium sp.]|uniref:putative entry exclusion protein TrbK-alt n=1 Tax=Mesorhizobium sp. TaxID=1871066 RepID=UPI001209E6C8|nr:putative entry exclusion protein TrbK-alt [Mesorhizobium sp.]TIR52775.1 MAG: conjugal transfer protein TrbK [Mesorhizobium sp.]
MDGKMLARLAAVIFIAVAITATVIELTRKDEAPTSPSQRLVPPESDPLRESQRRCQQLGQKAAEDTECLRVWAKTRDRFLGRTRQPVSPSSSEWR